MFARIIESQLLDAFTMEPIFLAAGGPENIITRLGHHFFIADAACDLNTLQKRLWNLLSGAVVDTE